MVMSDDLISRRAVITIIENKRLLVGKHDLSAEYKLTGVQEQIERLSVAYDVDKVVEQIDNIMEDESIRFCEQAVNAAKRIVKSGGVADE